LKPILPAILALFAASQAEAQTAAPAPAPPAPSPCAAPEFRQFDFWVGKWDVFNPTDGNKVGESLIEAVYRGCGIRENWQPKAQGGGSLNIYQPALKTWHQSWIDSSGTRAEFEGAWNGKAMVLEGDWPTPPDPAHLSRTRMTYTPNPDGSVRQEGLVSIDNGKTWAPSFDFIYRRAAQAPAS
jgi:hypothetical protein